MKVIKAPENLKRQQRDSTSKPKNSWNDNKEDGNSWFYLLMHGFHVKLTSCGFVTSLFSGNA